MFSHENEEFVYSVCLGIKTICLNIFYSAVCWFDFKVRNLQGDPKRPVSVTAAEIFPLTPLLPLHHKHLGPHL